MRHFLSAILLLAMAVPVMAETEELVIEYNYYKCDGMSLMGLGANGASTYMAAMLVPGTGQMAGAKVAGIRIPIDRRETLQGVEVWVATTMQLPLQTKTTKTVDVETLPVGLAHATTTDEVFATVMFDTAVAIPRGGCYVGYTLEMNAEGRSTKPVLLDATTQNAKGGYVWANTIGGEWTSCGSEYGVLGATALVSDIDLPEANAWFDAVAHPISVAREANTYEVTLHTNAKRSIEEITYELEVDGAVYERTATAWAPAGFDKTGTASIWFKAPRSLYDYEVTMRIAQVNGVANVAADSTVTVVFENVSRRVERNTLVEELTGTGCGWCPRGMVGMAKMRAAAGDRFVGVALHLYNGSTASDAMFMDDYRNAGFTSAPQMVMDGQLRADPFQGSGSHRDITGDLEEYLNVPATADIDVQAQWTDAGLSQIAATATVEALAAGDYEMAFVVVADSLHGTTSAWRQMNYYAQYEESGDAELDKWCRGGEWALNPYPFYNDVAIASSYEGTTNDVAALEGMGVGDVAERSCTLTLPAQPATLAATLAENKGRVYVVAFVLDGKGRVAQARKVAVTAPDAVQAPLAHQPQSAIRYNLAGQRVNDTYQGIVVVDGKKYRKQ